MYKWSLLHKAALILSAIGGLIIVVIIFGKTDFNDYSFHIDVSTASSLGDFIGGFVGPLFSLAGVFLLFETLKYQRMTFVKQQFENKFFELLKIYRENVAEMIHKPPGKENIVTGRRVFVEMRKQFGEIYNEVCRIITESTSNLNVRDKVNISYLILFFGVGDTSNNVLEHYIRRNYKDHKQVIDEILYSFTFDNKYDGHQSRLGHYFRHLFQMVKFVDKEDCLTEEEKYFYVKTLRAQLSTYELAIFFLNSLSDFGKPWSQEKIDLIEKYKFIKNIPFGFTFDINPKDFYPKIIFEADEVNIIPS